MIARLRGVKTAFRVLKTYDRWVSRHPAKDALKRFLFRRVDGIETTGSDGKEFAMNCGAPGERIFFTTHAIDIRHFATGNAKASPSRKQLRERYGLRGTTFIYVGRLWWGKGINILLKAFEKVQREFQGQVSLLLVGDGPEELELRQRCTARGIHNVVFVGFQQKPELPKFYAMADVFVFPTLGDPYGLVVDEAMACSLPVISSRSAGDIRDRIDEGVNGFIVPPEDSEALADRMLRLTNDPLLCARMGEFSVKKIASRTHERWAEDFERMVFALLARDVG